MYARRFCFSSAEDITFLFNVKNLTTGSRIADCFLLRMREVGGIWTLVWSVAQFAQTCYHVDACPLA